ncbi:MAG: hypothetical protein AB7O38_23120, partial [Pirellulaceae bacterium]
EAVARKLREANPGFDGKVTSTIEASVVTALAFLSHEVTDISPVRALTGLKSLSCGGSDTPKGKLADLWPLHGLALSSLNIQHTAVSDLVPLRGMPLTHFECYWTPVSDLSPLEGMPITAIDCARTNVSDLSPLSGMPLALLYCNGAQVSDLSPLAGRPLISLICDFQPTRDTDVLRAIKTLEKINGKPAAEFWKEVDGENQPTEANWASPAED